MPFEDRGTHGVGRRATPWHPIRTADFRRPASRSPAVPTDPHDPARRPDEPSSPYGPQHGHVDDAAGGADSSPFEDVPSGERQEAAAAKERPGKTT